MPQRNSNGLEGTIETGSAKELEGPSSLPRVSSSFKIPNRVIFRRVFLPFCRQFFVLDCFLENVEIFVLYNSTCQCLLLFSVLLCFSPEEKFIWSNVWIVLLCFYLIVSEFHVLYIVFHSFWVDVVKNNEIWEPVFSLLIVDSQNFLVTFIRGCHFSNILTHVLVSIMFL